MRYLRITLAAALAFVCAPTAWGQPQAELILHFVEIGQGDCTLIECPNGGFILVDAGSTPRGVLNGQETKVPQGRLIDPIVVRR